MLQWREGIIPCNQVVVKSHALLYSSERRASQGGTIIGLLWVVDHGRGYAISGIPRLYRVHHDSHLSPIISYRITRESTSHNIYYVKLAVINMTQPILSDLPRLERPIIPGVVPSGSRAGSWSHFYRLRRMWFPINRLCSPRNPHGVPCQPC